MSNENVPFELITMSDSLKKKAAQIDNLVSLILIMLVLWLFSEFYNGFEYAKTNFALFILSDSFTQKVQIFENDIDSLLSSESFKGTCQIIVRTGDGEEFYWYTKKTGNHIYPIVKIIVQADQVDYGFDVRITTEVYPENDTLRNKIESNEILYLEPFSGIVQDVSRQIMRQKEFNPPNFSLLGINAPAQWFPLLIALFSIVCSQIIKSYSLNLVDFVSERKRHEYKGTRRAFLDRITELLTPSLLIQSYQNKRWYPFSKFIILMISIAYIILIVVTSVRVNFYLEYNDFPIVIDLAQSHFLNALLVIGSLLIIKKTLDKLTLSIAIANNKKRKS